MGIVLSLWTIFLGEEFHPELGRGIKRAYPQADKKRVSSYFIDPIDQHIAKWMKAWC